MNMKRKILTMKNIKKIINNTVVTLFICFFIYAFLSCSIPKNDIIRIPAQNINIIGKNSFKIDKNSKLESLVSRIKQIVDNDTTIYNKISIFFISNKDTFIIINDALYCGDITYTKKHMAVPVLISQNKDAFTTYGNLIYVDTKWNRNPIVYMLYNSEGACINRNGCLYVSNDTLYKVSASGQRHPSIIFNNGQMYTFKVQAENNIATLEFYDNLYNDILNNNIPSKKIISIP